MPRSGLAVCCVLALSVCATAQKPQTAVDRREAQPDPLVGLLLAQARQATASVPRLLAPGMLSEIARDELGPGRRRKPAEDQPALMDFQTAFALALALPAETGDPVLDTARAQVKTQVEQEAVAELARHEDVDAAVQITRSADVPKAPLYNQLLMAIASAHAPDKSDQKPLDAVEALVDECERVAGAFPYRGVAAWLRREDDPGLDQMLLVQGGYQWASQETDPSRIEASVPFLLAGHRKEPELDQKLESTIEAQLGSLRTGPLTLTQTTHNAARGLLTVLRLLDPLQAAQRAQQWPQMNLSGGGESRAGFGLQPRRRFQLQLPPPADAAGVDPSGQAAALQSFRKLVHEAESQRHRNPNQALALAGQASSMLDATLWPVALPEAVLVAALERELGDTNDAAALLESCLDEADRQARSDDAAYLNGDPDALAGIAQDVSRAGATVLEAYSEAARVDFAATAAHALSAQFTLLRPLVLARVALVGAMAARRAAREAQPH